jgi:aminoglycoside phosphotransferase (APT) family kinase protein
MPEGAFPERIEAFCEKPNWLLYALVGAGPGGSTIIAKRRRLSDAFVERTVYEQVLPSLPIAAPDYYGCKEDGQFVWLLLQAVDGARYSESNPHHLVMAAHWVGAMHTAAARQTRAISLPTAGPERYLAHLVTGRDEVQSSLRSSKALTERARVTLRRVIALLDRVEQAWPSLQAHCEGAPITLVHADFRPKNAFVRRDGAGLVAFDWEMAGWGPPAPDLTRIDTVAYWSVVRESWAAVSLKTVLRWTSVGRVFQMLAAIDWESRGLRFDTPEMLSKPVSSLKVLGENLARDSEPIGVLS